MRINKPEPSAIVVPFGKHKGATVAELLVKDPAYAEWVSNQGWVAERFAELHAAILSRGASTDDSPEHNAIQVRFLDEEFRLACVMAAFPDFIEKEQKELAKCLGVKTTDRKISTDVKFEYRGVDVVIVCRLNGSSFCTHDNAGITVEIKPIMGDDFPSVMRQMARLGSQVLVVEEYHSRAVSEPQLRQMFEANCLSLIFVRDIEAELVNARAELA